jgi:hypothetical protein
MPESAIFRLRPLSVFLLSIVALSAAKQSYCSTPPESPADKISQLLRQLTSAPPDTCMVPPLVDLNPDQIEQSILDETAALALQQLNLAGPELPAARERATESLSQIMALSGTANADWPEESRFHFEFLSIPPALVLRVGIGTHEGYFIFGVPVKYGSGKTNLLWQQLGEDQLELERQVPRIWMKLYPLHRGPSANPRFLAAISYTGCAGSSGILYDIQEWDPTDVVGPQQIVKQKGAFGMDEAPNNSKPTPKDPFAPIGKLETKGPIIALPYCWFSAIDTWDNPSICALDTYDLSGDTVKFKTRSHNRPDLLPIAKAIEYAENHDFPAARGYCASDDVARKLVEVAPRFTSQRTLKSFG